MIELSDLLAREAIRDLVVRYNSYGDSGLVDRMLMLFAPEAEIEFGGHTYRGLDEMQRAFSSVRPHVPSEGGRSAYLRHCIATHQIDLVDATTATGRCYFFVLTAVGLDHWGRYLDDYRLVDGDWRFARRRVLTDALSPDSIFARSQL